MDPYKEDRIRYSAAALARLAFAAVAAEIADRAAELVPVAPDASVKELSVSRARDLYDVLERLEAAAVVYQRERGDAWGEIGRAMGNWSAADVEFSFGEAWKEWRAALEAPVCSYYAPASGSHPRLPEAAYEPRYTGVRLDDWAVKHGVGSGPCPVSWTLPALDVLEEASRIVHAIDRAVRSDVGPADLAELYETKAEIYTRLAARIGPDGSIAEETALALARAGDLRRQASPGCPHTDDHAADEEGKVDRPSRVSAS
ncbi:hypothetical protein ACFZBU_46605 [Embleya sp. NPDC008237]|uniref:hypothetical protein n=1 Tax=Embleya sp. NPDC008237 TaxID=3363978 RepID=UPI0036E46AD9